VVAPFTFVVVAVAAVMIVSTVVQYHRKHVTFSWALFWSGLWIVATAGVFITGWLDRIGSYLTGGSGRDLILYSALIVLFLVVYRLFLALQRQNEALSRIVEELAKKK
jgi:hypothetical protein